MRSSAVIIDPPASGVSTGAPADEEVVRRVLAGEKEAYEIIMRRYNRRLFRISRAYVGDADEAEDVVQQAYISAYEHLPNFEGRSRFSTWLTRIVINEAMARRRQRDRSGPLEALAPGKGDGRDYLRLQSPAKENPDETLMNDELRIFLDRSIDGLPEKYRLVFVMREVEGMSVAETGRSLGLTAANVKVRLSRAKEMLRRNIGAVYLNAGPYRFDLVRCDRIVAGVLERVKNY